MRQSFERARSLLTKIINCETEGARRRYLCRFETLDANCTNAEEIVLISTCCRISVKEILVRLRLLRHKRGEKVTCDSCVMDHIVGSVDAKGHLAFSDIVCIFVQI